MIHLQDRIRRRFEDLTEAEIGADHIARARVVTRALQLQHLLGGNRQPEKLAGMQTIGRAFQHAIHQQAWVGVGGQNDERQLLGMCPQSLQCGAPTPARAGVLGED